MGSAIFANEIRPVGDTTLFFEAVREAAKRDPSEGPLAGGAHLSKHAERPESRRNGSTDREGQTPNIDAKPDTVNRSGAGRSRSVKSDQPGVEHTPLTGVDKG